MSHMIGGYLVVPLSAIRPIGMSLEEALRFTLTAGITGVGRGPSPQRTRREDLRGALGRGC
jgi:uncharacterized membrane protein